jgi:hypothetical protein
MRATEFKYRIKLIKESLKGITIQFVSKYSVRPLNTLKDFGNAILEQEQYGNSFSIGQVWTIDGIKSVKSFDDLVTMLNAGVVTALRVEAYHQPENESEYMRSFGSLD